MTSESTKLAVWNKGTAVEGYDPGQYRKDRYGKWIAWTEYGQTTKYGWEIDHIKPKSKGGSDSVFNLQPLHWSINRKLGAKD